MYLFYLSHLLIVSAGHLWHLLLQLLTLTVPYLSQSLLLNMHFDPLPFLVLNFEDILLVVFATCSSDKHLVLRLIWLGFGYLREDKRFSLFFFRVVDWVNHLFRVHRCNINKIGNLWFPQIYFSSSLYTYLYIMKNRQKSMRLRIPSLIKDRASVLDSYLLPLLSY